MVHFPSENTQPDSAETVAHRPAWDIAWLVETGHAREIARVKGGKRRGFTMHTEFDWHAATELALLIESKTAPEATQ